MRARPNEGQKKDVFTFFVDQKPVGINMAFPLSRPVSRQGMVVAVVRQRRIGSELFNDVKQGLDILALFQHQLDVFFELRGTLDDVVHESRSSRSSSMVLNTLPTPGFLSSSASRNAA